MNFIRRAAGSPRFWIEVLARVILFVVAVELPLNVLTEDVHIYWRRAHELSLHYLPYRNFLWEYPPLSAVPLVLIPLTLHSQDGFFVVFVTLMIISEYSALCILRRAFASQFRFITAYWSLTVLPLALLGWFRLDFLAILLATIAFVRLSRGQTAGRWLVLGFLAKLWPIVLVVVYLLRRNYKPAAVAIMWCLVLTVAWYAFSPHGFHEFLRYREGGGFQIESLPGSFLLLFTQHPVIYEYGALNIFSHRLEWISSAMSIAAVIVPLLILGYAFVRRVSDAPLVIVAMLVWTLCLSRLLSAQYVLWLVPFVAVVAQRYKLLGALFFAVVTLTTVEILVYHPLLRRSLWPDVVLLVRNVFLIALAVEAFRLVLTSTARETSERIEPSGSIAQST